MTITMIEAIQAHNEAVTPEFRNICRDLTIDTPAGQILIKDFVRTGERIVGDSYASWTVIAERSDDVRDPYVVWTLVARPNGWHLEGGTYCTELSEAELAFSHRIGVRA